MVCFIWDTQHAVLFCQSLCMSAFELRLDMPCEQMVWEANTASAWAAAWKHEDSSSRALPFLTALKCYLARSSPSVAQARHLGAFPRVLVLHGIMATFWDMQRREQTSLGVITQGDGSRNWRHLIAQAYDAWKDDFDSYCESLLECIPRQQDDNRDNGRAVDEIALFAASYKALYRTLHLILHADILDIQIYAGAKKILGRPVQQKDYLRSARVVKRWAAEQSPDDFGRDGSSGGGGLSSPVSCSGLKSDARLAAWHASTLLCDSSSLLLQSPAMAVFHVPWCLYLATLTCWAYHHARPWLSPSDRNDDVDGGDEMVWDPEGEMLGLVTDMAKRSTAASPPRKTQTNGLVWSMSEGLSKVRWGIVHAGVVVLRGLVPQRLINQYEEISD